MSFEPTKNLLSSTLMRFEPAQEVGWSLSVEDPNGLDDIMEVRIELGNDESLGVKYTVLDNTCQSLDERLLLLPSDCLINTSNGLLNIDMSWGLMLNTAQSEGYLRTGFEFWWLLVPAGLAVTLLAAGFFFAGRAMDEVINPRLRSR